MEGLGVGVEFRQEIAVGWNVLLGRRVNRNDPNRHMMFLFSRPPSPSTTSDDESLSGFYHTSKQIMDMHSHAICPATY